MAKSEIAFLEGVGRECHNWSKMWPKWPNLKAYFSDLTGIMTVIMTQNPRKIKGVGQNYGHLWPNLFFLLN